MAGLFSLIRRFIAWRDQRESRQLEKLKQRNDMEAEEHKLKMEQLDHKRELYEQEAKLGGLQVKCKKFDIGKRGGKA